MGFNSGFKGLIQQFFSELRGVYQYCDFHIGQHQLLSILHLSQCLFLIIECCFCPMYLLLLRRASLFRHGGVYSLQSVREAQSEAASYRTGKGNTRTGHDCWLWTEGRKRTNLYLSGYVQPHAGRAERMCISSPFDIRVIKIITPIFCSFCVFQQLRIMQCVIIGSVDFRAHKKIHCNADGFPVLYLLLFTLSVNSHLPIRNCTILVHKRCSVSQ